ncbi:hemagglutinin repeat-containing protein [Paraburkholderia humisilvae]|uniref:Filamentous haemagglutinin FhaB/tRNA nuclease CdiA-like TPS domain-containing protein n=1 Tax=Paraburkholderia humisilvae TaxID=627669 RepID=A0A6J5DC70_9BURK|nr:hemagglutinin repeat-containing protein [Paraburkholderia humisilvae]CAB3751839.1 hypothetical protein LMG29542_01565 [Paraburkholderia humisilvae]
MNKNNYRLAYSRLREMLVAVAETATASSNESSHIRIPTVGAATHRAVAPALRPIAFAILVMLGGVPSWSRAQTPETIVPAGPNGPTVIQTQNGLPQVNIHRPSSAGVSMNTYGQFDVPQRGAILNNSPTVVRTQQAGLINGNPDFGGSDAARVIVNQVNSSAASQINGYLEVAGRRAEVVIANGSGISVNGGGFINTSRAILTTGTPNFAADGSLAGFNVSRGTISIQGAGLNGSEADQVDLLARAVQANAAIYAKDLNVVTGANAVDHGSLNATPITGDGSAPGVSIDVSQLGGMYANRIVLVGTEKGVGVSTRGVLAAQAGDLILTAQGKLELSGQTTATGDISASARDGIDNSGVSYAQQNVSANTAGAFTSSGVLAAQRDATVSAGSVASSGTFGAGVNRDGTIAGSGNLSLTSTGALVASGRNVAGGNATVQGGALSLAGSRTSANGAMSLAATGGDLNLAGATTTAGGPLHVSATGTLTNDDGTLASSDNGALVVNAGALSNNGGTIATSGALNVSAGAVANRGGALAARTAATLNVASLDNSAGGYVGARDVSVSAQGSIDNSSGQIEADGDAATLAVTGAMLDNTNGRIANTGTGATTVSAAGIINRNAGTIGGNGDVTVNAQSLSNTNRAQLVAGHDLTLNITQLADNTNATLSGANHVTLNGPAAELVNAGGTIYGNGAVVLNTASLDNSSGRIGNEAGSGGSVAISTGALANQAGAIGSDQNLSVVTGTLTGDGTIIAGNDGAVTIGGDYTLDGANNIQANHDLTFTTAGTFTNQGTLGAVNALTVSAANVENQAGAKINAIDTTVNAAGAISNAGRIEGDSVTTHSTSLSNIATIVGNTVTLNAGSITNSGAAAAVAAASAVNLYASGGIANTGGASIFSLGDINIAADGTRDANGLLANRVNTVTNDQSTIEAQGNIEIAADTLTNTRPAPTVETVTTGVETTHETKRDKYMACTLTNANSHSSCTQDVWDYGYLNLLNVTYNSADVVSTADGPNAVDRMLVVNVNGQPQTIYYNTITANRNGTITVTYWDDYDPHVNFDPATEYPGDNQAHHHYQRVEVARDTTITTQQDRVTGPQAQQAQLIAGGNVTLANVGTVNNAYSAIAAGADIAIGSNGYGATLVDNTGQTLYQYQRQDIVSTYAWNEDIGRDRGAVAQPSIILTPVAIGGIGGTIIANNAVQISATDISNTNVAAANSATGATGGTLGANGRVSDTVNAPQSITGPNGALAITLPKGGLFTYNTARDASYLVVTDPRLTGYASFISSDYMLGQLGIDPSRTIKRLGDGVYEQQLVRNQITQLTGRTYLQGYASNEDEYRALMNDGAHVAQAFSLVPGVALTAAQMDALTSDIVWLVNQTVTLPDGSTQTVLAPVVYLAHTRANDLQPTGALIAADDIAIHATGSANNSGVVKGGTRTVVSATSVLNRGGVIGSSTQNGTTVVSAINDVVNASGRITGNRVAVLAGHDIVNTTLVDNTGIRSTTGNSAVNQTLLGAQGAIVSTGDMVIAAGHDLTVRGASIAAGGDAQIAAGHDLRVDTVESHTSQSVTRNADNFVRTDTTQHQTSGISADGSLAMQSGNDMTFNGATVSAGRDLAAVAGGNLTATTVTNSASRDDVTRGDKTRSGEDRSYDEQAVGTSFTAGGSGTLAALSADNTKGNVALTGSTLSAGTAAANIAASGNVDLIEAREEHDSFSATTSRRGSFVHGSTTDEMHASQTNVGVASTVSGETVTIGSGKDLTVRGSNVVGTYDVKMAAAGNVTITTSQDAQSTQSDYQKREYGFLSGLNLLNQLDGGLQGYSIGVRKTTDAQQSTQVTNNASMVGSLNGNLSVSSGNDLHVTGSTLHAGHDVNLSGKTVTIDAARNTATFDEQQSFGQTGITAGLSNPVIAAAQTANQMRKDVQHTKGDVRLNALAAATTGLAVKNAFDAVAADPSHLGGIGVNVSLGTSHSHSNTSESVTTVVGSSVSGGRDVNISAAGAGANSNVTVTGSDMTAGRNATLDAQGNIVLQVAQNSDVTRGENSSTSGAIGVTFGFGQSNGISFEVGVSGAKGHGSGADTAWTNTHVAAGDTLALHSGGDTTLRGATADAQQVVANIGGNLNIESLQDTSHYDSKQTSGGVSVSVCVPPICYGASSVSGNLSQEKLNSDYASVTEQSGIRAGDRGFQIDVKGNTDLKGGVIASSDAAVASGANSLSTTTLTHSDIENWAAYSGSSVGVGGGYGGSMGTDQKGKATNVNPIPGSTLPGADGVSLAPPVALSASDDARSTTRSAISDGAIRITDDAKQRALSGQSADEAVASISRDTSGTQATIAPIFDKEKIEAGFDIASQFVAQAGVFVNNRAREADAAKAAASDPNLTPEQRAAAQQQADQLNDEWGPKGSYRQVLTALTVAAGGNVTGGIGQYAQAATVAYFQELGTYQVKKIADSLDSESARAALHAIVGCAGAAASSQGCGAGAMGAAASSVIGSLLKPTENMSAVDRVARENLVNSLVAGIATATGTNAATATGAARIEVENNQVSIGDWAKRTYGSPVEDLARWAKEFAGQVASNNGQTPPADADPLADAMNGGKPPTGTAGAVVTPVLAGIVAAACAEGNAGACASMAMGAVATPGSVPGNVIFNNGNDTGNGQAPSGGQSDASLPTGSKANQFNQPKNPAYQPTRNTPANIDGTDYAGHALDRMQDRGLTPSVIKNTIDNGVPTPSRGGTTVFYDPKNNVSVVTNSEGKVITVKYGK